MLRNFRKPLTLYKCMKKWYISQAFSIFSTRYKNGVFMYSKKFYIHTFLQIDKYNNDIDMNRAK